MVVSKIINVMTQSFFCFSPTFRFFHLPISPLQHLPQLPTNDYRTSDQPPLLHLPFHHQLVNPAPGFSLGNSPFFSPIQSELPTNSSPNRQLFYFSAPKLAQTFTFISHFPSTLLYFDFTLLYWFHTYFFDTLNIFRYQLFHRLWQ